MEWGRGSLGDKENVGGDICRTEAHNSCWTEPVIDNFSPDWVIYIGPHCSAGARDKENVWITHEKIKLQKGGCNGYTSIKNTLSNETISSFEENTIAFA